MEIYSSVEYHLHKYLNLSLQSIKNQVISVLNHIKKKLGINILLVNFPLNVAWLCNMPFVEYIHTWCLHKERKHPLKVFNMLSVTWLKSLVSTWYIGSFCKRTHTLCLVPKEKLLIILYYNYIVKKWWNVNILYYVTIKSNANKLMNDYLNSSSSFCQWQ